MGTITLFDPTAPNPAQMSELNRNVEDLRGKTIGFQIGWSSFEVFMDRIEELLRERYEIANIIRVPSRSGSAQSGRVGEEARNWEHFLANVDTTILGLAT
jgi:ABC-type amino acid transport substrate-binding protein